MGYDGNPLGPTNGGTSSATSNDFYSQLAKALAALAGGVGGRAIANSQGNPLTSAVPPQLSQLLDQSVQRQAYQNPLYQATTQGVYDMLPDFAKTGTQLSGTLSNQVQPPSNGGTGSGPGIGTVAALGGGSALAALLSNANKAGSLEETFSKIKSLFGTGGPASGSAGGPASPGTFGKGPLGPGQSANPSNVGTPFDIGDQGGPNDLRAIGSDKIAELLRLLGGGDFGSAREPGGAGTSAGTTGYF